MRGKTFLFFILALSLNANLATFKGNGKIFKEYIRHKPNGKYIFRLSNNKIRIFLRARSYDVSSSFLIYQDGGKERKVTMVEVGSTRGKQYFYVDIPLSEEKIEYYFLLKDGKTKYYFGEKSGDKLEDVESFKTNLEYVDISKREREESLVWYQIYIDRFRKGYPYNSEMFEKRDIYENSSLKTFFNGSKRDKFRNSLWTHSFSEQYGWEKSFAKQNSWYTKPFFRKYGGDFQGVIDKLGYIKELGVDAILLSPIFYSYSSHKYDVIDHNLISPDYANVDDFNDEDRAFNESLNSFKQLILEAHARDLKVVIDFPMNSGREHFAFKDVLKRGKDSKYFDWYYFKEDGTYESVDGKGLIPKLNHENQEVRDYLLKALNMVVNISEDEGIDGIIFDADSVSSDLIDFLREQTSVNGKRILFISNPIKSSSNIFSNPYTKADMEVNYRVLEDLIKVFKGSNRSAISSLKVALELNRLRFPKELTNSFITPLSTVDRERIFSSLINLYESNSKSQENSNYRNIRPDIESQRAEGYLKISMLLSSTYIGSPMLCYGDEIGMWGANDPDNRKQMIWEDLLPYDKESDDSDKYDLKSRREIEEDRANKKIYYDQKINKRIEKFTKDFFKMRKKNIDLFSKGSITFTKVDREIKDSILTYYREYEGRVAIILINFSDKKKKFDFAVPRDGSYYQVESDKLYKSSASNIYNFEIDAMSGTILFLN